MHSPSTQAPCVPHDPDQPRHIDHRYACLAYDAMGCRFETLIDTDGSAINRCDAQAVIEEMQALVLDWHHRLSLFEPASIVSQINRADKGIEIFLDDDMYALLELCEQLRVKTKGAFNVAAGTLMHAHGFRSQLTHATPHSPQSLDDLNLNDAVRLNHQRRSITKSDPRVSLDFGAIAKGFVLDLIHEELKEYGIENAFVHGGTSSILAVGHDHAARPWSTRIDAQLCIELSGFAAGISESQSQTRVHTNKSIGHIMNPTTNSPADNTLKQVVCIHSSAAVADAYSTACTVSPNLLNELNAEPCTFIAFGMSPSPLIHDPLGVVHSQRFSQ